MHCNHSDSCPFYVLLYLPGEPSSLFFFFLSPSSILFFLFVIFLLSLTPTDIYVRYTGTLLWDLSHHTHGIYSSPPLLTSPHILLLQFIYLYLFLHLFVHLLIFILFFICLFSIQIFPRVFVGFSIPICSKSFSC